MTSGKRCKPDIRKRVGVTHRVVDGPLESSKGTNHHDTGSETVPETAESDLLVDASNGLDLSVSRLGVQLGDHDIGGAAKNNQGSGEERKQGATERVEG